MCAAFFIAAMFTSSLRLPIIGVAPPDGDRGARRHRLPGAGPVAPGQAVGALARGPVHHSQHRGRPARHTASTTSRRRRMPRSPMPSRATPGERRDDPRDPPGRSQTSSPPHLPTVRGPASVLHAFPDTLDVDRYAVDGKTMDSVVSVRELRLSGVPAAQRNWVNDHTVYTHGFGFVAAYGNQRARVRVIRSSSPVVSGRAATPSVSTNLASTSARSPRSTRWSVVPPAPEPREFDFRTTVAPAVSSGPRMPARAGSASDPSSATRVCREVPRAQTHPLRPGHRAVLAPRPPIAQGARRASGALVDPGWQRLPAVVDGRIQWIVDGHDDRALPQQPDRGRTWPTPRRTR